MKIVLNLSFMLLMLTLIACVDTHTSAICKKSLKMDAMLGNYEGIVIADKYDVVISKNKGDYELQMIAEDGEDEVLKFKVCKLAGKTYAEFKDEDAFTAAEFVASRDMSAVTMNFLKFNKSILDAEKIKYDEVDDELFGSSLTVHNTFLKNKIIFSSSSSSVLGISLNRK
jgi:hypothetical protein